MFRRPIVRRRGSPLLRTAIVGGAAYTAGKSAERGATREASQEQRLSGLERQQGGTPQQGYQNIPPGRQTAPQQTYQQPPPPQQLYQQSPPPTQADQPSQSAPATEAGPDKLSQLKKLGELRQSGVLTEAEFEMEKQKILNS